MRDLELSRVVGEAVDLVNDSCWDISLPPPGGSTRGKYVDLGGSPAGMLGIGGRLESKTTFTLNPGQYELRFDLAGASEAFPGIHLTYSVRLSLGPVYSEGFSLPSAAPFQTITRNLQIPSPTSGKLIFDHSADDTTYGLLLDNVKLTQTASTPPPGSGQAGTQKPATLLPVAKKWNQPGPPTPLAPGDEAIAPGPLIASGQTEASVTVSSGDPTGLIDVLLSAPKPGKKLTRGDCVRAVPGVFREFQQDEDKHVLAILKQQARDRALLNAIFVLIACLDYVNEQEKKAQAAALTSDVGGTARSACRPSTVPVGCENPVPRSGRPFLSCAHPGQ